MDLDKLYGYLQTPAAFLDETLSRIVRKNCLELYKIAIKNENEIIANNLDAMCFGELYAAARTFAPEIMQPLMRRRAYEIYSGLKQNNEINQIKALIKKHPYELFAGAQRARDAEVEKQLLECYAYEIYKTAINTQNYAVMSNAAAQGYIQIYIKARAEKDETVTQSILSGYVYEIYKKLIGANNLTELKYLEDNYAFDIFSIADRRLDSKTADLLISKKTYQIFARIKDTNGPMASKIARNHHTNLYLGAKTAGDCAAIQTVINLYAYAIYSDLAKICDSAVVAEFEKQYFIQIYSTAIANGANAARDKMLGEYGYEIYLYLMDKNKTALESAQESFSEKLWGQIYIDAKNAKDAKTAKHLAATRAYDVFIGLGKMQMADKAADFEKKNFLQIYIQAVKQENKIVQHNLLSRYPYQIYSYAAESHLDTIKEKIESDAGPLCYDIYKSALKAGNQDIINSIARHKEEIENAALAYGDAYVVRLIRKKFLSPLNIAAIGNTELVRPANNTEFDARANNPTNDTTKVPENLEEYKKWISNSDTARKPEESFINNWD